MIRMICYDIAHNSTRTKVSDYLEAQGFDRIQYSVFVGRIDPHRWQKIWAHLSKIHQQRCEETDRIYSHVIDIDHFRNMRTLGTPPDMEWILQELQVLFI